MQKRGFNFFNKKGTIIIRQMLIHLGMLGLLAIIYYLLQAHVDSIAQDTQFEQLFLSRDIALLMNSLYSAPGDVEYTYSFDKLSFKPELLRFELGEVSSFDDKPISKVQGYGQSKSYPYGKYSDVKDKHSISETRAIKFSKKNSNIAVTKNE